MNENVQRHDQKYWIIDGHPVTASFAKSPAPELLSMIRGILLGEADSYICRDEDGCIRIGDDVP